MKTRFLTYRGAMLLCLFSLLLSFSNAQSFIEVSGEINTDTVWSADTVKITGDVIVNDSITLTIMPGTYVEAQGYYALEIYGAVQAVGEANDSIIFTVKDNTGFSDPYSFSGGWHGIHIINTDIVEINDTSKIICCRIEFGKAPEWGYDKNGRGGGMFVENSSRTVIKYCHLVNNNCRMSGGAIDIGASDMIFAENLVQHNYSVDGGGGISLNRAKVLICENIIRHNQTNGSGGGIGSSWSRSNIDRNILYNNQSGGHGGGIRTWESVNIISNNLIVNNSAGWNGGGCEFASSTPGFYNNTVCNNSCQDNGGISFNGYVDSDFINNIIWGNKNIGPDIYQQIHIRHSSSNPNFHHCVIQGGTGGFEYEPGVIYTGDTISIMNFDPGLVEPTTGIGTGYDAINADWSLNDSSPLINSGTNDVIKFLPASTDFADKDRVIHGVIDVGALETRISLDSAAGDITADTEWIADSIIVTGNVWVSDGTTLTISAGSRVIFQGHYFLEIEGTIIALGTEQDPILFTVHDTAGNFSADPGLGAWRGLTFDNGNEGANGLMTDNDTSRLVNCTLEYAKDYRDIYLSGGAVKANYFSNLIIENCTLRNNSGFSGGGIGLKDGSCPVIRNNVFYKNIAMVRGGGICCDSRSDAVIVNNIFSNNYLTSSTGWPRGGGGVAINTSDPVFQSNIICNNEAPSYGGGILLYDSYPSFVNNTIVNNMEHSTWAAGGLVTRACDPVIYNSIFWGNGCDTGYYQASSPEEQDFYYCNIQLGIKGLEHGTSTHKGDTPGLVESDPLFISPSGGMGTAFDGLSANWEVTSLSPAINAGAPDPSGLDLQKTDFAGNPRINYGIVDIGAFENQDDPLEIIKQPVNLTGCTGENSTFTMTVSGPAYYQWYKNNNPITGAVDAFLTIENITLDDEANYHCVASNGYGTVSSNNVFLGVSMGPQILDQSFQSKEWTAIGEPLELRVSVQGTAPLSYQWTIGEENIAGATSPDFTLIPQSYEDEGLYRCIIDNRCGTVYSNYTSVYIAPEICMVTVDPASGNNLVVWEKNSKASISYYKIYRESNYAGIFDLMATVPYNDLSVILDETADPTSRAYIYKIAAVGPDNSETDLDLSNAHKTIHLLVTANPETKATQLDWDRYVGFDYGTYVIYRSDTTYGFSEIDRMSSSTSTWADPDPGESTKYYRIAALKPDPCIPAGNASRKADAGPYSHAMSNVEDNRLQTTEVEELVTGHLEIYPNPFNETAMLRFDNPRRDPHILYITDLSGKACRIVNNITSSEFVLEKGGLRQGLYFLELRGSRIFRGKIIVE